MLSRVILILIPTNVENIEVSIMNYGINVFINDIDFTSEEYRSFNDELRNCKQGTDDKHPTNRSNNRSKYSKNVFTIELNFNVENVEINELRNYKQDFNDKYPKIDQISVPIIP
ncbi:hypothetical protein RCL_jg18290.t1 [Rhizophagus clarus]|uniref:Uncharacterized protein n=1 Tax=Rhizophagus clarus TaxID=94130 RepID=A0A8H3LD40_9GLOM|nr:hypothetical protein RCL_jg18290.t1 [Rhizophagus clarus]